jgi:hypothetical protein
VGPGKGRVVGAAAARRGMPLDAPPPSRGYHPVIEFFVVYKFFRQKKEDRTGHSSGGSQRFIFHSYLSSNVVRNLGYLNLSVLVIS